MLGFAGASAILARMFGFDIQRLGYVRLLAIPGFTEVPPGLQLEWSVRRSKPTPPPPEKNHPHPHHPPQNVCGS